MRSVLSLLIIVGMVLGPGLLRGEEEGAEDGQVPGFVLIEFFHSEGCSSCPPAEQAFNELETEMRAKGVPVYTLAFHVDYWNRLGWTDPYSAPAYSARQREYVRDLRLRGSVTPSAIVNGYQYLVGRGFGLLNGLVRTELGRRPMAIVAIADLQRGEDGLTCTVQGKGLIDGLVVNLAVVEGGLVSEVTAGENEGKTLKHEATVRAFTSKPLAKGTFEKGEQNKGRPRIDTWQDTLSLDLPDDLVPANAGAVVYLQDPRTRRIHAAGRTPLVADDAETPVPPADDAADEAMP